MASLQKEALKTASEKHKEEMLHDLDALTERFKKVAGTVLLIGGGVALSWYIFSQLTNGSTKSKKKHKKWEEAEKITAPAQSAITDIKNVVMAQSAAFLLSTAKGWLMDYLNKEANNEEA